MNYPKFPQRFLATIVFCLLIILGALGALFLLYMFNEGNSPLVLSVDESGSSNTVGIIMTKSGIVQMQHKKQQNRFYMKPYSEKDAVDISAMEMQLQHNEDGNHDLDDVAMLEDDDGDDDMDNHHMQHQTRRFMQNNHMKHKIKRTQTSIEGENDRDPQYYFERQQREEVHEHQVQTPQQHSSPVNAEIYDDDDLNVVKKHLNKSHRETEDVDQDDDITIAASSSELSLHQPMLMEKQSTNNIRFVADNLDTIYIDDFERPNSLHFDNINNNQHMEQFPAVSPTATSDKDASTVEISSTYYLDSTINKDKYIQRKRNQNQVEKATNRKSDSADARKSARQQQQLKIPTHINQHKRLSKRRQQLNKTNNKAFAAPKRKQQNVVKRILHLKHIKTADNLDTLYDNRNINYDTNDDEENDAESELIAGSGSGHFEDYSRNNYISTHNDEEEQHHIDDINLENVDAETTDFIERISIKMMQTMGNANKNKYRKAKILNDSIYSDKQQQHVSKKEPQTVLKSKHPHDANYPQSSSHNQNVSQKHFPVLPNLTYIFNPLGSEIVTNLTTPQLFQPEEKLMLSMSSTETAVATTTITELVDSNSIRKNRGNVSIRQQSLPRVLHTVDNFADNNIVLLPDKLKAATEYNLIDNHADTLRQKQHPPAAAVAINVAASIPDIIDMMPVTDVSAGAVSKSPSSAAWLETRTRRIIGNFKKSEERSRQLLLCEEAGGGELCRMLFKGHLNE